MIGAIRGELIARSGDSLIVDVSGVGYEISASAKTIANYEIGSSVSLFVYTDVKENAITLYGFERTQEKEVFLLLKKVKGVGSKLGVSIVSESGAEGVLSAIGNGDTSALCKVSGVGKRTAERILVELREQVLSLATHQKLEIQTSSYSNSDSGTAVLETGVEADVIQALQKLGFSNDKAKSAVVESIASLTSEGDVDSQGLDAGEVLKVALANL